MGPQRKKEHGSMTGIYGSTYVGGNVRTFHGVNDRSIRGCSDCQGFWNLHGLRVGYRRVRVWVQIPVPASYKTSSRTSKTDENWQRYGQNSRKYCFAHISVISGPFWLFLGSKTRRVAGKGPWGKGTGWKKKPQGYPWQSLREQDDRRGDNCKAVTVSLLHCHVYI